MMIGRTRVALGPLRDLGHLDAVLAGVRGVHGVGDVAVDAFEGRQAVLAVQVLRPVDLTAAIARGLGLDAQACRVEGGRIQVALDGAGDEEGEAVDATPVSDDAGSGPEPGDDGAGWATASRAADRERPSPWRAPTGAMAVLAGAAVAPRPVVHADATVAVAERPGMPAAAVRCLPAVTVDARPGGATSSARPATGVGVARGAASPAPADPLELLELSFAHAPVAKAIVDRDGRWVRVNHRLRALLGREDAGLLGRRLEDLAEPAEDAADERLVAELVGEDTGRWAATRRFVRPDGGVVPVRLQAAAVRDPDGAARWFVLELVEGSEPLRAPARVGAAA